MTTPAWTAGEEFGTRTLEITREDVRRYAEASGDRNPIHLDDEAARALGLDGVVAHGMLVMALSVGVVAEAAGGADRLRSTEVRFASPVGVPPDGPAALEVAAKVRKVDEDSGDATVALTVSSEGRKVLGKALVVVAAEAAAS